jgi:rare lipoprotein A
VQRLLILALALTLAGCGSSETKGDGPGTTRIPDMPGDAVPRSEPRSRYGNGRDLGSGPGYEVFGQWYSVMDSSAGYKERGVASWYGKKFHGNLTSNREVYDMYEMTAAHKSLPLPTYVRVKNLRNDKSIVVRVNDRGPFVGNRIIDLSYAAALKLDMVRNGTGMVEVTAINFDPPAGDQTTSAPSPSQPTLVSTPSITQKDSVNDSPNSMPKPATHKIYVQVGAFGERSNAARRQAALQQFGIENAFVHEDSSSGSPLFRVRIGPVANVEQYDELVKELDRLGINDPYLITE